MKSLAGRPPGLPPLAPAALLVRTWGVAAVCSTDATALTCTVPLREARCRAGGAVVAAGCRASFVGGAEMGEMGEILYFRTTHRLEGGLESGSGRLADESRLHVF